MHEFRIGYMEEFSYHSWVFKAFHEKQSDLQGD